MICSVVHTCTCLTGRNPWLPCAGVPKFFDRSEMRFLLFPRKEGKQLLFRHIDNLLRRQKIPSGQLRTWHHRDCQKLVITFKELKFTELQIKIRNHIIFVLVMHSERCIRCLVRRFRDMNCPPRHGSSFFRTAYPAKVCDEICICGIGLFHSDIGLSVIRSGLWVYTEDVRLVGHENLAGR